MKGVFILFLFFFALNAQANDTLTRAQVYNFNVGDTFDYKHEDIYIGEPPYNGNWDRFSYYRIVITSKYYSQNQDTLFYARKILGFPNNFTYSDSVLHDTLLIAGLQMPAISYDYLTLYYPHDTTSRLSDSIANVETFSGRTVNKAFIDVFEGYETADYATGLGEAYLHLSSFDGAGYSDDNFTTLIYYSQVGETWGTPYNIAVGVTNISQQNPSINLFPTINNGQFKIKIENGYCPSYQLTIYDFAGREVKRTTLNNGLNDIDIPHVSAGMYLWNVTSQGTILQSGKMVVN